MAGVLGWVTRDEWAAMQNARRRRLRASGDAPAPRLLTEDGDRLVLETGAPIIRDITIPGIAPTDDPFTTAWMVMVQDGDTVKASLADVRTYLHG